MKKGLPKKRYKRLWKVQRSQCYLCGKRMKWLSSWDEHNLVSIDHITPKILGGTKMVGSGNVALACRRCNTRKGDRFPTACELLYGQILADLTGEFIELKRQRSIQWPPRIMSGSP